MTAQSTTTQPSINQTRKYFGTDGMRGPFGETPITPECIQRVGWAAGQVLTDGAERPFVYIARDTRESGEALEQALISGFASAGVDCYLLGVAPTPVVAYLTKKYEANAGLVISASHNGYQDNGIKFFSHEGVKLSDDTELQIEAAIEKAPTDFSDANGQVHQAHDLIQDYITYCQRLVKPNNILAGLNIILDCANGATYDIAPTLFAGLGANVTSIHNDPNGTNINDNCGSTQLQSLMDAVIANQADVGIAFDGDGDRVIMVDHLGEEIDGDEILFIIAKHAVARGQFTSGVVGTHMTNMGLELALNDIGVQFSRSAVGDRYVIEALQSRNWILGGETSGHIICLDVTTTGDGMLGALKVLLAMNESEMRLNEIKQGFKKLPQALINVKVSGGAALLQSAKVQAQMNDAEQRLNGSGRVLLRPSGTEPVIRVMVEGEDPQLIDVIAKELAEVVQRASIG